MRAICLLIMVVALGIEVFSQGTLNIALLGIVDTLNPFLATTGAERTVVGWIYETLARAVPGGQEPFLAESWEVRSPKQIVFYLRKGIKWHDGKDFTAEDVAFTFNYVRQKSLPMWVVMAFVASAEAIDTHTVVVNLTQFSPMIISLMAPAIPIIPKHIWESIENPMAYPNTEAAVGTGPFKLVEFAAGQYVRLKNSGFYWRGVPKLDEIIFHMVSSDTVGVLGFLRGDFDYLSWNISPMLAERISIAPAQYPNVNLYRSPGTSVATILPNVRRAPFDNPEFRRALSLAIDREDMLTRLLRGFGCIAPLGLMTPRMGEWLNEAVGYPTYDSQEASRILDALGYIDRNSDGVRDFPDGNPLAFTIICPSDKTSVEATALIAHYLGQLGLKITVEPLSPDSFELALKRAEFALAYHTIAAFLVVDMYYYYFHSSRGVIRGGEVVGFNRGGFADPELDEVLSALLMAQGGEKISLCHRVQTLLAQKLPRIPLFIQDNLEVYRDDDLTGWAPNPWEGVLSDATIFNLAAKGR